MLNCYYPLKEFLSPSYFNAIILGAFVLFVLFYFRFLLKVKALKWVNLLGILLIGVGGFSNLVQRQTSGCVVDGINLFNLVHFNISDILITVGTLILAFDTVYLNLETKNENNL